MFIILSPYVVMTEEIRRQHERDLQNDFNIIWKLTK